MNTLIITAHPSTHGFTHKIAKSIEEGIFSMNEHVEILNLYEHKQDFLVYEKQSEVSNTNDNLNFHQKKLKEVNEIIFIFPMWWGSVPAILKNFIDVNFTSGFAFKYKKGKMMPEGLFKGKKMSVYITCDSPSFIQYIIGFPVKKELKAMASFVGLKIINFKLISSMRKKTDKEKEQILDNIKKSYSKKR